MVQPVILCHQAASEAILQLLGDKLKSQEKNVKTSSALAGKVVGLYFAAKWNGPCRTMYLQIADMMEFLRNRITSTSGTSVQKE